MFRDSGTSIDGNHLSFLLESEELPGQGGRQANETAATGRSPLEAGLDLSALADLTAAEEAPAPPSPYESLLDGIDSLPSVDRDTRRQMQDWAFLGESLLADVPLQGPVIRRGRRPPAPKSQKSNEPEFKTPTPSMGHGASPGLTNALGGSAASSAVTSGHGISNATLASISPAIRSLAAEIATELERNLYCLLSLNPSRREALARHLDCLAGLPHGPSTTGGLADAAAGLRRWIEGPRTQAQEEALRIFIEEVALFSLTQAILLKAWSDRGVRKWREQDIGQLNWVLSHSIKPFIPLNRESWQLTRPNLYSWYNPSTELQRLIWDTFREWDLSAEGPDFLATVSKSCRPERLDWPELKGYDLRFISAVWDALPRFGFDFRKGGRGVRGTPVVFSPTLRDGAWVRSAPVQMEWIGTESYPFQLMIAEMAQLWWGPAAPPLWAFGTGLEAHSREQLAMSWNSPKPSLFSLISEMEACDLALVLEERIIRAQGKSPDGARLKSQLDSLPYFKKIRSAGTSLGDLQACVAMTKLRPGGLMLWVREQPLGSNDGQEMLKFLLERGTLISEWDFSRIEHSLPATVPPFPRHIYLFRREVDVEARRAHRPEIIQASGPIRSHVEVPGLLADVLAGTDSHRAPSTAWKLVKRVSPTSQQEWADRWPDPAAHESVEKVSAMDRLSVPLGQFASVRTVSRQELESTPRRTRENSFWQSSIWVHSGDEKNCLRAESLATAFAADSPDAPLSPKAEAPAGTQPRAKGPSGFMLILPGPAWVAPMTAYLQGDAVQEWMNYHVESRAGRWMLKEQNIKLLPVPKALIDLLGAGAEIELPADWRSAVADLSYRPGNVLKKLRADTGLPGSDALRELHSALFVRASEALAQLEQSQQRLFSLVTPDGRIRWRELLAILPPSQCLPFSAHPDVRLAGTLPPHLPIATIRPVKTPLPGLFFATESGLNCHAGTENPLLLEMLTGAIDSIRAEFGHPTWSELTRAVTLPRSIDMARTTAGDILRSHGEQSARRKELIEILSACSLF